MDKSGEYYLKNINLQNRHQLPKSTKKNSLNNPQNLEHILKGNIGKIKRRASKIVTLLPENSLTPIPKKEGINKLGIANGYGKKELNDAQRTAVFIRRLEYATSMKKQMDKGKNLKNNEKKIELIQQWWKTMFKIIKLQKNIRGFLFRKKLMNNLEHQEKLLKFITDFDNIHNYHVYKQFMDKLKAKRDYEKAKLMEKCEDFSDKLDNLERLHNLKNFKNCFDKWRDDTKRKKKQDLDRLAKNLNDILKKRINKNKLDTLKELRDKTKDEEERLNDKAKQFREKYAKKKFLDDLIKAHKLNKLLSKVKKGIDDRHKKDALDKLKNNDDIAKAAEKLNKLLEDKLKKQAFDDLKTMDFVDKVDDVLNNHDKRDALNKLKDLCDKDKLRDKLKKWKDLNDEQKNINKIINKLKRYKQNQLKNKFAISSGVNDFTLKSNKKEEPQPPKLENQISSQNDINFVAKPTPKLIFEKAGQNFSLIAPEIFQFEKPIEKNPKINNNKVIDQIKNLDRLKQGRKFKQTFDTLKKNKDNKDLKEYFDRWRNNAKQQKKDNIDDFVKKLNDILSKAEKESDKQNKKDVLDKLKKMRDIAKAVEKLDNLFNTKPKKDTLDTLKKNSGMSEGFRVLDKLFKKMIIKIKKMLLINLRIIMIN